MIPVSGKAEIHLLFDCDLACRNCNRASFLNDAHTPALSVADFAEFCTQARTLDWWPAIIIIGGEPTLHPDFFTFCELAVEFVNEGRERMPTSAGPNPAGHVPFVQLWSNHFSADAREKCAEAEARFGISVNEDTNKTHSMILPIDDIFVSPIDVGLEGRPPCWQHASQLCGISVDSRGYSPCAIGGAIDGILDLGFRTKILADLFDPEKAAAITEEMCGHCGHQLYTIGHPNMPPEAWRAQVDAMPKWRGMHVSPTWEAAFDGRR